MAVSTFRFTSSTPLATFQLNRGSTEKRSFINALRQVVNAIGRENISASIQANVDGSQATGTVTAAAVAGADTVTINGVALTATQRHATGTVTAASVLAADTFTLNSVVFTAVTGTPVGPQFDRSGTDTQTAASLVAAINASASASIAGLMTATNVAGVVTIRAVAAGTAANAYTLVSSNGGRLAVSAATLTNGAAITNNTFDFTGTDTQTAADLVRCIGASTSTLINTYVTAANVAAVVTITAIDAGDEGNIITLASSNGSRLAVSAARLTGGLTVPTVTFNFGA